MIIKSKIKVNKTRGNVKPKFVPRPPEDPEVIAARWEKKKNQIHELANDVSRLRLNVSKDLNSDVERTSLIALIIAIMDRTGERIGNPCSIKDNHYGVTYFLKKHITVKGNEVELDYVGKSGVQHNTVFKSEKVAKALKTAIKNSPSKFAFETSDGLKISETMVNSYLSSFNITGKVLRGYHINKAIVEKLSSTPIPETEKERKKLFNKAVKRTAGLIGHGASTCKKHYIVPELPEQYITHGKIIDLKSQKYYKDGGKVESDADKNTFPVSISLKPIKSDYTEKELQSLFDSFGISYKIKKYLGKGAFGKAYESEDGRVIKVTNNGDEAFASAVIKIMGDDLKRQAKVYNVHKITDGKNNLYIIEKEKVEVLSDILRDIIGDDVAWVDSWMTDAESDIVKENPSKKKVEETLDKIYNSIIKYLKKAGYELDDKSKDKLNDVIRKQYEFMKQLQEDQKVSGLKLNDSHNMNIGFSGDKIVCFDCVSGQTGKTYAQGGIPNRYKEIGFTRVGQKKKSTRPEKKWMVLAKKGDKYKVVHGGQKGMEDFSQHHDKKRQRRFWNRMGGFDSEKSRDPFSPLYWHKKFGTWEKGGILDEGTIKVAWVDSKTPDIMESKMFDSVDEALKYADGKSFLIFELEDSHDDYYKWSLLPYGMYDKYKTALNWADTLNLMEDGGKLPENEDFANSEKSITFIPTKLTKDDINKTITGSRSVTSGTAIQAASSYLRRSKGASPMGRSSYFVKGQDEERLREYISTNNLWLPLPNPKDEFAKGGEATVYLYDSYVIKINDCFFYGSWEDYFNSLLIHNLFFPRTSYELIGFSEYKDFDDRILYAVVKQAFINIPPPRTVTDLSRVGKFMSDLGFIGVNKTNYYHPKLGITVKDLHEGNVLTKDDTLYFIDTIFYLEDKNKKEKGGKTDKFSLENMGNISYEEFKDIQRRSPSVSFEEMNRAGAYLLLRQKSTTLEEKRAQVIRIEISSSSGNSEYRVKRNLRMYYPDSTQEEIENHFNEITRITSKGDTVTSTNRELARYFERQSGILEKDSEIIEEDYYVYYYQGSDMYIWNFWRGDFDIVKNEDFDSNSTIASQSEWLSDKLSAKKIIEEKDKFPSYMGRVTFNKGRDIERYSKGGKTLELNSKGGYDYSGKDEKTAEHVGLITLPKNIKGTNCQNCIFFKDGFCDHKEILLPVTKRMCCAYWNENTISTVIEELPKADFIPSKILKDAKYPLNKNGGYDYDGDALERAKNADLITLPKDIPGTNCGVNNCVFNDGKNFCIHPKVLLPITDRMSCSLWDSDKVVRPWGEMKEILFKDGGSINNVSQNQNNHEKFERKAHEPIGEMLYKDARWERAKSYNRGIHSTLGRVPYKHFQIADRENNEDKIALSDIMKRELKAMGIIRYRELVAKNKAKIN